MQNDDVVLKLWNWEDNSAFDSASAAVILRMPSVQTFRAKLSVSINERMRSFDISPARSGARNWHLLSSETTRRTPASWIELVVYHLVRRDAKNMKSMGSMHASVRLNLRGAETSRERTQNVYVFVYWCLSDRRHVRSKRYNKWLDKIT